MADVVDLTTDSDNDAEQLSSSHRSKRARLDEGAAPSLYPWQPFYLTTVQGISAEHNANALSFADLVHAEPSNPLVEACFMNYMMDLEWMTACAPHLLDCNALFLHGSTVDSAIKNSKWVVSKVDMGAERFGTHHSKMMLLVHARGLRVVISTANFIPEDFTYRTQGSYVQDFPLKSSSSSSAGTGTAFEKDLTDYLQRLAVSSRAQPVLSSMIQRLAEYDYRSADVVLVPSVPGRHAGGQRDRWGIGKLVSCLSRAGMFADTWKDYRLVMQCSSLGSMGKDAAMVHDYASRLLRGRKSSTNISREPFALVWPTVETVRCSLQGYASGNSLPCAAKTFYGDRPGLLEGFRGRLYAWDGSPTGRTRATPHMKCYFRYRQQDTALRLSWFLLTSANLSQAALGVHEKADSQLYIKSYEMGVLFLSGRVRAGRDFSVTPGHRLLGLSRRYEGTNVFVVGSESREGVVAFPVPFALPPAPYADEDEPWVWDNAFDRPDCLGRRKAVG